MPNSGGDVRGAPGLSAMPQSEWPSEARSTRVLSKRSLGFRLLITISGVIGVALVFTALVAGLLLPVRSEMSELASDAVPRALLAAKIDRQSAFVAAQASVLVVAKADRVRAVAFERISDELLALDGHLADLAALQGKRGQELALDEIRAARAGLADSFQALNGLVEQRIQLEAGLEAALEDLIDTAPIDPATVGGASVAAGEAARQVRQVLQQLPSVLTGHHRIALERLSESLRARLARARAVIHRNLALDVEIDRIEAVAFGPQGLITIRRQLFATERAIEGWLRENRTRSDILRAATASLLADTADRAAGLSVRINRDIGHIWVLAVAAAVILILAGLGIASRLYRVVLERLALIRNALGSHRLAPGVRLEVGGDDEISEIAAALERFGETIAAREAELRAAREVAVEAAETRSRFLAHMSHELRTPMTGILGMADLLLAGKLTDEQRDRIVALRCSADLLMSLLNDILDYSKIEAGRLELEHIEVAVVPLVERAVRLFEPQAVAKGLAMHVELPTTPPPLLMGDPYRLQQVVLNLVNNAVKFTHEGRVRVRLSIGSPEPTGEANEVAEAGAVAVVLEVEDTGVGLTEAQRSRLFQAFSQADASTTRRYGGTGLGLAITAHLVQLMSGTITCHSTPGNGTVFRVALPMQWTDNPKEPAATPDSPGEESPDAAGGARFAGGSLLSGEHGSVSTVMSASGRFLRVLLAEDNPVNRTLIVAMLRRNGHRVTAVADGGAALSALQEPTVGGDYDVAVLDIRMPVLDGEAVAERIRMIERKSTHRFPLVALTANASREQIEACRQAGFDAVLGKPIDWTQLQEILVRVTGLTGRGTEGPGLLEMLPPTEVGRPVANDPVSLFDPKVAREVAELVGPDDYAAMIESTRQHLDVAAVRLPAATGMTGSQTPDDDLVSMAHSLAGLGSTLGLTRLSVEASTCERLLRYGAGDPIITTALSGLHATVLETRRILEQIENRWTMFERESAR